MLETLYFIVGSLLLTALALERIRAMWPLRRISEADSLYLRLFLTPGWITTMSAAGWVSAFAPPPSITPPVFLVAIAISLVIWYLGVNDETEAREAERLERAAWDALVDAELQAEQAGEAGWEGEDAKERRRAVDERLVPGTWRHALERTVLFPVGLIILTVFIIVTGGSGGESGVTVVGLLLLPPFLALLWVLAAAGSFCSHRMAYRRMQRRLARSKDERRAAREG